MAAAAVLYVAELRRVQRFYVSCFGMALVESGGEEFCVLASDDWELSLVRSSDGATTITNPPARRTRTPIKLAFPVASIAELRPRIVDAGGQVDPATASWEFRGHRHLDCIDPEGNVVQLREPHPE